MSTAPFTQCSPHGSKLSTPGRQQRAVAVVHPSPLPCILSPSESAPPPASPPTSPAVVAHPTASPVHTPGQHADPLPCSPKPLISPEQHSSSPCASLKGVSHTHLSQPDHNASLNNIRSDLMATPGDDQMTQSAEVKPQSPCQSEVSLHLPAHSGNSTEAEGSAQDSAMMALSQEQTEETVLAEVDMFCSDSQANDMSFKHSPSACKTTSQAETVETCVSVPSSPRMMSTTPQQVRVLSPEPSDRTDACVSER